MVLSFSKPLPFHLAGIVCIINMPSIESSPAPRRERRFLKGGGAEPGRPFPADKSQFTIIGPHGRCLMGNPAPKYYVSGRVWAGELLFGHLYANLMHGRRHPCSYCGDANHFFVQFPSVPAHSRATRVQPAHRGTAGPVKEERWHWPRTPVPKCVRVLSYPHGNLHRDADPGQPAHEVGSSPVWFLRNQVVRSPSPIHHSHMGGIRGFCKLIVFPRRCV
ncbi:hypothetical protein LX36DRAFT_89752 [Colletotrichum falcatum]|nr:hypothetical protein LX36DRAFT_89752 [Colletotrichum falcatum]